MNMNLTEVVFILDRSGSMSGLESDTIGGFNSMLEQQRKGEGQVYISTILFDDKVEVLHDRVDIAKVEPMNDTQYYVRGCTALLDAVGSAIHHIGNVHKYAREEDRPTKTLFVITTDGMENASRLYSYKEVKKMIERQQTKYGWEFLFLGANIDAMQEAARFGIRAGRSVNYVHDEIGTRHHYEAINKAVSCARGAGSPMMMSRMFDMGDALAELRKDYEERGTK